MRLMARQAIDLGNHFGDVGRVGNVGYRVSIHRMSAPKTQRQHHDFVLREVVLGKLHASVEDREHVIGLDLLRLRLRPMALQAQPIRRLCPQQVIVLAAVRLVARRATLLERRLMQRVLLGLLRLIAVAGQADIDRIGFGQARLTAGVRIVAVGAIPGRSRVRDFRLVNLIGFLRVAGNAQFFCAGCGQNDFAVLGCRVAGIARLVGERRMQELPH